ncbi:MAG: transposase [Methylococcaceae bacterium]|nr:transposase [Methylococcaceae bacterium]
MAGWSGRYRGYDQIFATGKVLEVACWAHTRRKFFEIARQVATGTHISATRPWTSSAGSTPSNGRPRNSTRTRPAFNGCGRNRPVPSSPSSRTCSKTACANWRPKRPPPRPSAMPSRTGRRWSAIPRTVAWRSTTTAPSGPSGR